MIINGYNIEKVEDAENYLKSQGVDVDKFTSKGLMIIDEILQKNALAIAGVSDLLPCPFCGSEAETHKSLGTYSTMCSNSECSVCPCAEGETRVDSIVNWNKRQ